MRRGAPQRECSGSEPNIGLYVNNLERWWRLGNKAGGDDAIPWVK